MSFETIRAAFESRGAALRPRGEGFTTQCPAHDDANASLSCEPGTSGGVVVRCFAGCTFPAIAAALGVPKREWFAPRDDAPRQRDWIIRAADGTALAVHRRFDRPDGSKTVLWFGPDGRTPSKRGTPCVIDPRKLPLYGVHDLTPTGPVVVTEGEKSADALRSRGIPAVGTVCGASSVPCDESLAVLAGRDVVLWPDNDDPGRTHMARIAARLADPPRVIEWHQAPLKGDAADFDGDPRPLIAAARPIAPAPGPTVDEPHTDLGIARRFLARHGADWRFAGGSWLHWDGSRWIADDLGLSVHVVAAVARSVAVEAGADEITAKAAAKQESASHVRGALALAAADPAVAVSIDAFDRAPLALACRNAVVDLRTGAARPQVRTDYLTAYAPHDYDPRATCPRWERFIREIMLDREDLIGFLRRWAGYCLTGETSEQVLVFAIGSGSNGKGVFVETLMHVMGKPLADAAAPNLLLDTGVERHPTEMVDLKGRRFVVASEVKKGSAFSEAKLKWLTGGDTIKARAMHSNFVSFTPTHKFMVLANHMPTVRDASDGFWRRLRVLPFDASFRDRPDPHLSATLRAEAPGILAWLVRAAAEWHSQGLGNVATISSASAKYRDREDLVGRFLRQYEPGEERGLKAIHESFVAWAAAEGESSVPKGGKTLAADLEAHGWSARHTKGGNLWSRTPVKVEIEDQVSFQASMDEGFTPDYYPED